VVAATQLFVSFLREEGRVIVDVPEWLVALSVVGLGLLMVSPLPYRSGKELDLRHSFGTLVLVVIALLLVIIEPKVTLFGIGVAYVMSGPVDWLWRRHTGATLEEMPAAPPTHAFEHPPRG
jgi:phosphatidylserine synthase